MYVVAEGATDRRIDTTRDPDRALSQLDSWLRQQSGGTGVRLDTYQGDLDVSFLPLPFSAADAAAGKDCSMRPCPYEQDLLAALYASGTWSPDKWYVFFYEGGITYGDHNTLCGGALPGNAVLINLDSFTSGNCAMPWAAAQLDTFSVGLLVGHELFHSLGALCPNAPGSDGFGHSTIANDVMAAGANSTGTGIRLDAARNAYWGAGVPPGCTNIATHPLMTTAAN